MRCELMAKSVLSSRMSTWSTSSLVMNPALTASCRICSKFACFRRAPGDPLPIRPHSPPCRSWQGHASAQAPSPSEIAPACLQQPILGSVHFLVERRCSSICGRGTAVHLLDIEVVDDEPFPRLQSRHHLLQCQFACRRAINSRKQ
jgi:hypothetical protein